MSDATQDIRIRRGELNGPLSDMFLEKLHAVVTALDGYEIMKGPNIGASDSPRPGNLPEGSIFLYAETGPPSEPVPMGSICLIILHSSSPNFKGLPVEIDKAGEVKRTIVLEGHRRQGVAQKLLKALEDVAKNELGLKYIVIETVWGLEGAQSLYESAGYSRREAWGLYDERDSLFYEKWL